MHPIWRYIIFFFLFSCIFFSPSGVYLISRKYFTTSLMDVCVFIHTMHIFQWTFTVGVLSSYTITATGPNPIEIMSRYNYTVRKYIRVYIRVNIISSFFYLLKRIKTQFFISQIYLENISFSTSDPFFYIQYPHTHMYFLIHMHEWSTFLSQWSTWGFKILPRQRDVIACYSSFLVDFKSFAGGWGSDVDYVQYIHMFSHVYTHYNPALSC